MLSSLSLAAAAYTASAVHSSESQQPRRWQKTHVTCRLPNSYKHLPPDHLHPRSTNPIYPASHVPRSTSFPVHSVSRRTLGRGRCLSLVRLLLGTICSCLLTSWTNTARLCMQPVSRASLQNPLGSISHQFTAALATFVPLPRHSPFRKSPSGTPLHPRVFPPTPAVFP